MTCALCLSNKNPIRNSHIIPEWVYTDLYDAQHRFNVLATIPGKIKPHEQKGLREKLLCNKCEQQFSIIENYARKVLYGGEEIKIKNLKNTIHLYDIDYSKFKLFQLSILWRASIASHELFSKVTLGPHQETLRQMLQSCTPGAPMKYPCIMFGLTDNKELVTSFIDQVESLRLCGIRCYRFIFSGFIWIYFVASHNLKNGIESKILSKKGELSISLRPFSELTYLKTFKEEIEKLRPKKP